MQETGTASDLARMLGVSKVAVSKAIKSGRLKSSVKLNPNGRGYEINLLAAGVEWRENNGRPDLSGVDHRSVSVPMDKRKPAAQRATTPPPFDPDNFGPDTDPDEADGVTDLDGNAVPSSIKSRRILDHFKAQQAKLDYLEAIGKLVPIEEVAQTVGREYANVRAALLALPGKLADELAACEATVDARAILEAAITEALTELTADRGGRDELAA